MITYAVVVKCEAFPMFDGNIYAHLPGMEPKTMARCIGRIDGKDYAMVSTFGSALKVQASLLADKVDGWLIEVNSQYWPDGSAILNAMREMDNARKYESYEIM